jgi:1-acyl-sn-glycerol-3-phosphate acyltransferase
MRFIAMEVISDVSSDQPKRPLDVRKDRAILAFAPHGIFPFGIAFGALPEIAQQAFGIFRPVVAAATDFFPIVRDFLKWIGAIDASRASVDRALSQGERIGLVPGGIAEIFEGYPKPGTLPSEEYTIVKKGFLRMAIRHGVPVIPVYCFGATKMMKRLEIPWLEELSRWLRVSICIFFGAWGLPIPFRQRLSYVIGDAIYPPPSNGNSTGGVEQQVEDMHQRFCSELLRIFDRHKEAYGWAGKTLMVLTS